MEVSWFYQSWWLLDCLCYANRSERKESHSQRRVPPKEPNACLLIRSDIWDLTWDGFCWCVGFLLVFWGEGCFLRRKKQRQDSKEESEIWVKANMGLLACWFGFRKGDSQKLSFCLNVVPVLLCFMVVSTRIYSHSHWLLLLPPLQGDMWYRVPNPFNSY